MGVEAARAITRNETTGSWALWFAVLGSPLAWVGHLVVNYSREEWFACSPSATAQGEVLGFGVDTVALAVNAAMALMAAASGLVALRCRRRLATSGNPGGDERIDRARWMALTGIVEGALFLGIILFGFVPPFVLGVCETIP
ncbi:MAG: hypothetical protein M3357_16510 [Actinomycetota bacterium]|nr:hypothetical protein [Actinomycetota bacterium]